MFFKHSRCLRERVTVRTLGIPLPFSIPSADLTRNRLPRVAAAVGRAGVPAGALQQQALQVATSINTWSRAPPRRRRPGCRLSRAASASCVATTTCDPAGTPWPTYGECFALTPRGARTLRDSVGGKERERAWTIERMIELRDIIFDISLSPSEFWCDDLLFFHLRSLIIDSFTRRLPNCLGKKNLLSLCMEEEDSLCESIAHFGLMYDFGILYHMAYSFQINTQMRYPGIYVTLSHCYRMIIVRRWTD